ncbi:CapA family protein [Kosakonia sp. MUSA4]|uniref:CapA family protein n=1 Tax=Kosakonia sp. MUSA4 TaxID=2067958 RepID=UPI00159AC7D6|nr:CapA family protein [Kosakonia sp. MUSA4]QJT82555.1 hypothetical protein C0557_21990 [Kosakonia sp. MUSA4]
MSDVLIASFGDILINRSKPKEVFGCLSTFMDEMDLIIGNYEGVLTDNPQPIGGRRGATLSSGKNVYGVEKFSVLSLANNHALDSGTSGLSDTIDFFESVGVKKIGAGFTHKEAWEPVYVECKGLKIAIFGITGVYRAGTDSNEWQGGVAAIRSRDYYSSPYNGAVVPGALPLIHTEINEDDWNYFAAAVRNAQLENDIIVAMIHWGDHQQEFSITQFEKEMSIRMQSLGIQLVVGHHHHQMRGFRLKDKLLICYGLGNAVFDQPNYRVSNHSTGFLLQDSSRYSGVTVTSFDVNGLAKAYLLPIYVEGNTPVAIEHGSTRWSEFMKIQSICASQGMYECILDDRGTTIKGFSVFDLM